MATPGHPGGPIPGRLPGEVSAAQVGPRPAPRPPKEIEMIRVLSLGLVYVLCLTTWVLAYMV